MPSPPGARAFCLLWWSPLASWSAYLLSALLWFWYGLRKRDPNIYLPCIGWLILDGAVLVGTLLYR